MATIKKIKRKDDKHVLSMKNIKNIIEDKSSIIPHNALYQQENDIVIRWKDKFSHRMILYALYKLHKCHQRANA